MNSYWQHLEWFIIPLHWRQRNASPLWYRVRVFFSHHGQTKYTFVLPYFWESHIRGISCFTYLRNPFTLWLDIILTWLEFILQIAASCPLTDKIPSIIIPYLKPLSVKLLRSIFLLIIMYLLPVIAGTMAGSFILLLYEAELALPVPLDF